MIIFSSSSVLAQSNDKKANAIVEEMVTAMGGMNYDAAHFIQWDFVNENCCGINGREMFA
jgi:hypothetical protein